MEIVFIIIAFILLLVGLLGVVIPGLPGPPLSYLGLLFIKWSGREFSAAFLIVWALITIIVTVLDYILPSIMTKRFGGSKAASIGSVIGLIAGIFFFPPWGLIIGPFIGAFTGEAINNRNVTEHAFKAALGAFLSFFVGTGIKLIACAIMMFYAVKSMF